jgi:hypothetical protein
MKIGTAAHCNCGGHQARKQRHLNEFQAQHRDAITTTGKGGASRHVLLSDFSSGEAREPAQNTLD